VGHEQGLTIFVIAFGNNELFTGKEVRRELKDAMIDVTWKEVKQDLA